MRLRIIQPHGYSDRHGNHFGCGVEAEFPTALAVKLLHHRIAVPAPKPVVETVAAAPKANAAKRIGKPCSRVKKEVDDG